MSEVIPACPKCGSTDGYLGTSFAYFSCHHCGREQYWTPDHEHPGDWSKAIAASPWARARKRLEDRQVSLITMEMAALEIRNELLPDT